jgi:hypothetical protein
MHERDPSDNDTRSYVTRRRRFKDFGFFTDNVVVDHIVIIYYNLTAVHIISVLVSPNSHKIQANMLNYTV